MRVLHVLRWVVPIALLVSLLAVVSCGGNPSSGNEAPTPSLRHTPSHDGAAVELSAKNNRFSTDRMFAPDYEDFSIFFTNDDAAPHNVAIYTSSSADEEIYVGETFSGPGEVREYVFETPGPADYFFRCDVHPDKMTGEFTVE